MNRARDYKKSRGLYGGGCLSLPYVLLRDMPKEEQIPVIYEAWRPYALDLFQQFAAFNFETGRMARYIESKPYLSPTMPAEDLEIYKPVTNMKAVPGGYTFSNPRRLLDYLSNVVLGGYAHGGKEEIELDPDDPIVKEHRKLAATLRNLQRQRQEAAIESEEDPAQSIDNFYYVLSHLRSEFNKKPPQTKKDIIRKLIEEVEVNAISPHLYTLHITWIRPIASVRDDVALLWRSDPTRNETTTTWLQDEDEAVRTLYPDSPQLELMQGIPNKSPAQIKKRAGELAVRRKMGIERNFWWTVTYKDLEAAAQFTSNAKEQAFLWQEINTMAENTQRGQLSASWFLPLDVVSFSHALFVTDEIDAGQSRTLASWL